jgi:hypothetical protein
MRDASQMVLHLTHPRQIPWTLLVKPIADDLGVPMVTYSEWLGRLSERAADNHSEDDKASANPALQLLEFFQRASPDPNREPLGLARLDNQLALQVSSSLKGSAPLKPEDARRWVEAWRERGFLPSPNAILATANSS